MRSERLYTRISNQLALLFIIILICGCGVSRGRYEKLEEEKANVQSECGKLEEEVALAGKKAEQLQRKIGRLDKTISRLKAEKEEMKKKYEELAAENMTLQVECRELKEEYQALTAGRAEATASPTARAPE